MQHQLPHTLLDLQRDVVVGYSSPNAGCDDAGEATRKPVWHPPCRTNGGPIISFTMLSNGLGCAGGDFEYFSVHPRTGGLRGIGPAVKSGAGGHDGIASPAVIHDAQVER